MFNGIDQEHDSPLPPPEIVEQAHGSFQGRSKRAGYVFLIVAVALGAFLAGTYSRPAATSGKKPSGSRILYYQDPMHPEYRSDKPGTAPDCGMDLEPVYAGGSLQGQSGPPVSPADPLEAGNGNVQTTGIVSEEVRRTSFTHTIRTVGHVVADETRVQRMIAGSGGWVREITSKVAGTFVKKGDLLAIYYGRDFQTPEMTYIYVVRNKEKTEKAGATATSAADFKAQLDGATDSLLSMGLSDNQLQELARTLEPDLNIELRAPMTGFILANNVYNGSRFERGYELIRMADLSHVWVTADLFRNETANIKAGSKARIAIPEQNRSLTATVSDTLPQFDPTSRSTKVRLELQNPGQLLRPDMFVDVEFPIELPPTLHIPVDSVIGSGLRKTVYVQRAPGVYEPRAVETGWQFGDQVEIASGIREGERVVRSGAFLLDSETRMTRRSANVGVPSPQTGAGLQVKDPVCGMPVKGTEYRLEYGGVSYRFCSSRCKAKFEANKDRYARSTNAS